MKKIYLIIFFFAFTFFGARSPIITKWNVPFSTTFIGIKIPYISDGFTYQYVNANNSAELAAALGRLMGDEALRHMFASRAVGVRMRFSMTQVISEWEALFKEIIIKYKN